ncbi:MAG: hypothetical protein NTY38_13710 [Acidobacteria bacterium]|nr:hypothetical protein [Acidobacteriota bacterium]
MTILFWNLDRKPLTNEIVALVQEHEVDLLILAESTLWAATLLDEMNTSVGSAAYHFVPQVNDALAVFARFPSRFIVPVFAADHVIMSEIRLPGQLPVFIVMAHLRSKLYQNQDSQHEACCQLADDIREWERKVGHTRTIVIGDLNANPFEPGMVGAKGLHAVMSRGIAERGSRIVQKKQFDFFYNPMWSLMGDLSNGPPGSYYFDRAEHVTYFWNMFDQVLVRPSLAGNIDTNRLRILTRAGSHDLTAKDGRPCHTTGSDHLPLMVGLNF